MKFNVATVFIWLLKCTIAIMVICAIHTCETNKINRSTKFSQYQTATSILAIVTEEIVDIRKDVMDFNDFVDTRVYTRSQVWDKFEAINSDINCLKSFVGGLNYWKSWTHRPAGFYNCSHKLVDLSDNIHQTLVKGLKLGEISK